MSLIQWVRHWFHKPQPTPTPRATIPLGGKEPFGLRPSRPVRGNAGRPLPSRPVRGNAA
jgi:hypothetical protein